MAEPLEINISKSFVEYGGKQWATYESGGGVTVQIWKGQQLEQQKDLSYAEYAEFREKASEIGLRAYPDPALRPKGGTSANGNTLGRVVGETAPAAVPAIQANPPIEAETEEEGITGDQVLDGIQLGLDVVGLIPVVGEVADIASAAVSVARGDYVGAGLSLLSAIPFVGYAGTAGKAARYGAKMAEASGKAGKEAVDKAAKEAADKAAEKKAKEAKEAAARKRDHEAENEKSGGKIKDRRRLDVKCFKKPEHLDDTEFVRQLKEQEDAINAMSANKMLDRHLAIKDAGGTKALRVPKAQEDARKAFEQKRLIELGKLNIWGEAAEKQLAEELKDLAATHRLDIIAGGDPKDISGMGGKGANSSIGPQWKGARTNSLKTHAEEMIKEGKGQDNMHVKLKKC